MSAIHEAQRMVYEVLDQEVKQFGQQIERHNGMKVVGGTKDVVRAAQSIKWDARRIARLAYAVEVLESCDPHYPR